ncbi:MAG: 50S ribosomal protein L21 [Candidatus Colwellbacteria bacterium]|nr:50S ribosomal protein L21 [Candidatus Colwellbacteria bacterium]
MFAVIKTGGKQYRVSPGTKLKVEKLTPEGENFVFDKVLLVSDGKGIKIGKPYLDGARVEAKVLKQGRAKKVIVFRYKSKTRQRKKKGHRQPYTEIEITKIG